MKFEVIITETITYTAELSAKNHELAEEKALDLWEKDQNKYFEQVDSELEIVCEEME